MNYVIISPESQEQFDAMWRLNYITFAEELGQHEHRQDRRLIDKFHGKNVYRIAWNGADVLGMIAAHACPPFSAVGHFGDVIEREILPGKTAEIRIFALAKAARGSVIFAQLCDAILSEMESRGIEKIVITGIASQKRLYEAIGFHAVGEAIVDGNAIFFPMAGTVEEIRSKNTRIKQRYCEHAVA